MLSDSPTTWDWYFIMHSTYIYTTFRMFQASGPLVLDRRRWASLLGLLVFVAVIILVGNITAYGIYIRSLKNKMSEQSLCLV